MTIIDHALKYIAAGISVTLADENKKSIGTWEQYRTEFITKQELNAKADRGKCIAVICGERSGNLEVIDIDTKYDITGTLYDRFCSLIDPDIFSLLTIARTVSGGYHFYLRSEGIEKNQKLARRPSSSDELKLNQLDKVKVLIETRGSNGYVIAPPSSGYTWIQGDYTTIPTLSIDQRQNIIDAARSLNEYISDFTAPTQHAKQRSEIPGTLRAIDDFNAKTDLVELLVKHGWTKVYVKNGKTFLRRPGKSTGTSGDVWHEKNIFSTFSTSTQFEENKGYSPAHAYKVLHGIPDWSSLARELGRQGYGDSIEDINKFRAVNRKIKESYNKGGSDNDAKAILLKSGVDNIEERLKQFKQGMEGTELDFYSEDKNGKPVISHLQLRDFIQQRLGYYSYPFGVNGSDSRTIRVESGLVYEVSEDHVSKNVIKYVEQIDADVAEVLSRRHATLFCDKKNKLLDDAELNFLRDDKHTAYFPFINGVVRITKDKIDTIPFDGTKHIWKSALIEREVEYHDMLSDDLSVMNWHDDDEFTRFIWNICGGDDIPESETSRRFFAVCTHIGYLLHKFKDPSVPPAVILAEETDNELKGGGTGKGIFVTALNQLVNTETVDGKNFKLDKSFAFQRVGPDTRILAIQDVRQKVDFEGFYSIITEGITVERKGKQELFIPFELSPKVVFTTNYMIPDQGVHARRRQRVIPFSSHYNANNTPAMEFGHLLFKDWDKGQWMSFHSFMFSCVRLYLNKGLVEIPTVDSMRYKGLNVHFGEEFSNWFKEYSSNGCAEWSKVSDLYAQFLNASDFTELDYSKKRFRKALSIAADSFRFKIEERNHPNYGGKNIRMFS